MLALYGHPDAGGFWEQRCEDVVTKCGWVRTSWASLYVHTKTRSLLIICVDDFRMAAKPEYTVQLWGELRKFLRLDMPTPPDRFPGCYQHHFTSTVSKMSFMLNENPLERKRSKELIERTFKSPNKRVQGYKYEMGKYCEGSVGKYCTVANVDKSTFRKVATPFIDESKDPPGYVEASDRGDEPDTTGQLAKIACSIIMTLMFCARLMRNDLLRSCAIFSTFVHKWKPLCDKMLMRLMCYLSRNCQNGQIGFVGDPAEDLYPALYANADFAGDKEGTKSTSGWFLALMGLHAFFPLSPHSKK